MVGRVAVGAFAVSSLLLLGLSWTVLVVVYPGFAEAGATGPTGWTAGWAGVHAAHGRRMTLAVTPLWLVEGLSAATLLVVRPAGVPLWLVLAGDAGAALTVVLTVGSAIPAHAALASSFDPVVLARLRRGHAWRTLAWLAAAGCGTAGLLLM